MVLKRGTRSSAATQALLAALCLAAFSPVTGQILTPGPAFGIGSPTPAAGTAAASSPTPAPDGFKGPRVLKAGRVTYPILANLNRIEGVVGVRFAIDENGKVTGATVYKTSRSLTLDAVVKARGMQEWTFEPATLDGKPIPSTFDKDFEFRMDPAEQREFALKRLAAKIGTPDAPYPPEALTMQPRPHGDCVIGVYWTPAGLVDLINLVKSSGSATLDHAALHYAYLNWRIDPKEIKDPKEQFTKILTMALPLDDSAGSPPPLAVPTGTGASPAPKPKRS